MASIHGVSCTYVKGAGSALKYRVNAFERFGINGRGAQLGAYGHADFSFRAIYCGTQAAVTSWVSSIEAKQGSKGTIIDDNGISYTNAFIVRVGIPQLQRIYRPGSSITHRVEIEVTGFQQSS